jgi:hypothetical protein
VASASTPPGAATAPRAAFLEERYHSRLPETLDDLTGPGRGTVQLPGHIAWSGLTAFNVSRPPLCISMYQIVLTEGLREDLAAYLNRGLLISHWPALRSVVGRVVRDAWEAAFPELTEGLPGRMSLAPKWRHERYDGAMATIQVKNVSDEAHAVLRQRATAAGQSLQEYMLAWIERSAARPTIDEVLDRVGHRSGGHLSVADVVQQLREERDRR